jgi:hypothetical protein
MNYLIIDDERIFTVVERQITYADRIAYAANLHDAEHQLYNTDTIWDRVYLDHDLGNGEDVSSLTDKLEREAYMGTIFPVRRFIIHSMNPIGRMRMYNALHKFYNVEFARVEDLL